MSKRGRVLSASVAASLCSVAQPCDGISRDFTSRISPGDRSPTSGYRGDVLIGRSRDWKLTRAERFGCVPAENRAWMLPFAAALTRSQRGTLATSRVGEAIRWNLASARISMSPFARTCGHSICETLPHQQCSAGWIGTPDQRRPAANPDLMRGDQVDRWEVRAVSARVSRQNAEARDGGMCSDIEVGQG